MSRPKCPENRLVNIDMDGTLFDFEHPIKQMLAKHSIAYADPTLDFYIANRYQDTGVVEAINSLQNSKDFFRTLPTLPGAIEGWQQIQEWGFYPRICSKPLRTNPYCKKEKLEVIDAYFGPEAAASAYLGSDKENEPGIALIDDRPGMTNGRQWQRIIFTQPWNQHETGLRLNTWSDPNLYRLLSFCAQRFDYLISGGE